jgi:hypothetical protein
MCQAKFEMGKGIVANCPEIISYRGSLHVQTIGRLSLLVTVTSVICKGKRSTDDSELGKVARGIKLGEAIAPTALI